MKYLIIFGILSLFILGCESCKEEIKPILTGCGNGFSLNDDHTKCICPPETHYILASIGEDTGSFSGVEGKLCYPKGEFVYLGRFDVDNCFDQLSNSFLALGSIGYWKFIKSTTNENDYSVDIFYGDGPAVTFGRSGFPPSDSTGVTIERLGDGRVEINLATNFISTARCFDWSDKTDRIYVRGFGHGISNDDNTKIDIEVIYKDTDGLVLDTSYIHLWKE